MIYSEEGKRRLEEIQNYVIENFLSDVGKISVEGVFEREYFVCSIFILLREIRRTFEPLFEELDNNCERYEFTNHARLEAIAENICNYINHDIVTELTDFLYEAARDYCILLQHEWNDIFGTERVDDYGKEIDSIGTH